MKAFYVKILLLLAIVITASSLHVSAQSSIDRYKKEKSEKVARYKKKQKQKVVDYRLERNKEFARYLRQKWKTYNPQPAIPRPKDDKVPPFIIEEDLDTIVQTIPEPEPKPTPIEEVILPPKPEPQPEPIEPIEENKKQKTDSHLFGFFGTQEAVRFDPVKKIKLDKISENTIADAWLKLSDETYNNLVYDCLKIRKERNLDDWSYLVMLKNLGESIYGSDTNEAALLTAFVYCQSGYKIRIGYLKDRLTMLFTSKHKLLEWNYYEINGDAYYPLNRGLRQLQISPKDYPQGKSLSLLVHTMPNLAMAPVSGSSHQSLKYPDLNYTAMANRNMLDYYTSYPTSTIGDNFVSRWALYANAPMPSYICKNLYPELKKEIEGSSQLEAVNKILNFVQTGFVYGYDDKIWGHDRAFFPEESLYYPYCDCEDRSILLTRLVRDLLGLKCILIYYPGHLASAVAFTQGNPVGDYIEYDGSKYYIADGTITGYGAPVGKTMPGMENSKAKIILLD